MEADYGVRNFGLTENTIIVSSGAMKQIFGANKLISDRGGYMVVAATLGWPPTTVHTYCRTDRAPKIRWDLIAALPKVKREPNSKKAA